MKSYEIVALITALSGPVVYFLTSLTWPAVVVLLIITLAGLAIAFNRKLGLFLQKPIFEIPNRTFGDGEPKLASVGPCLKNPPHALDPNWEVCPYCEAEQRAKQKSRPEVIAPSRRERTIVGEVPPQGGRRETKTMPSEAAGGAGGQGSESDTRRIVGVLVTYTWRPQGQLFPIREGRNFLGRGEISSEPVPRDCDVQIPQDAKMSAEHALILCRHGSYEIIDQETTNGTFLNGTLLRANESTALPNHAALQTGSTVWTFLTIEAPHQEGVLPSPKPPDKPNKEPREPRGSTIVR